MLKGLRVLNYQNTFKPTPVWVTKVCSSETAHLKARTGEVVTTQGRGPANWVAVEEFELSYVP